MYLRDEEKVVKRGRGKVESSYDFVWVGFCLGGVCHSKPRDLDGSHLSEQLIGKAWVEEAEGMFIYASWWRLCVPYLSLD